MVCGVESQTHTSCLTTTLNVTTVRSSVKVTKSSLSKIALKWQFRCGLRLLQLHDTSFMSLFASFVIFF